MNVQKISNSYKINRSNNCVTNKHVKSLRDNDVVIFSSVKKKNNKKSTFFRNVMPYVATGGVIIASIFGLAPKAGEREKTELVQADNIPYIEEQTDNDSIESAIDILLSDSETADAFDKINQALNTYSEQLGEDALPLIKERVALLGNGKVDVIDVLKILWIESNGRIYDDNGEILRSISDAYGAFQITKDTQDYLNYYFGLEGSENQLDVKNPYDNLDACIYNLRFLHDKRSSDLENGEYLPTGDNIKNAVAWSYHDGAWASEITDYGQDYIEKYESFSKLDEYPQIVDFILNS